MSRGVKSGALELAPKIEAVIILDTSGHRLCAKYYSNAEEFSTTAAQTKFQNLILNKVNRSVQRNDSYVAYIQCLCFCKQ